MIMLIVLTILAILACGAILYVMYIFDQLVRWEYDHHRDQWEHDGKPDGYFWRPEQSTFWTSNAAKKQLGFIWLFKTPQWVIENPKCQRWLLQFRIISATAVFIVLALLVRLACKLLTH